MKRILIQNRKIGYGQSVFIIAEAGVNHNGKLDLALKLVDAAADVGADAIKFQTFKAEQVVTETGEMAEYQKKNTGKTESQIKMLKKLEFDENWYPGIISHCKKRGIVFLSTPHGGFDSVDLLHKLRVPAFKFGSGDLTNLPLLGYAARLNKPIILGTGMATMIEVEDAIRVIKKAGNSKIIILHCTTNYPCPFEEVNLRAMQTMIREFDVVVGYSDHTLGSQVAVMATTLGALVIEKHLTLDNSMPGPDHKASASPEVFKNMVDEIRKINTILGNSDKKFTPSEVKMRSMVRKSLVAILNIKKGDVFNKKNIGIKRPGTGLAPKFYSSLLNKKAHRNIRIGEFLQKNDCQN
ncbi:MAG: N-acetylneuraminate synthase [bacterium]|nr:N-acetylneuraminate synthase [bacterium]